MKKKYKVVIYIFISIILAILICSLIISLIGIRDPINYREIMKENTNLIFSQ